MKYNTLGGAGHFGVSRYFALYSPGGTLRVTGMGMTNDPDHPCKLPASAEIAEGKTWYCEDDAFIWFEFFDGQNKPITVSPSVAYSTTMSYQAGIATTGSTWTKVSGNTYKPARNAEKDIRGDFYPIKHK